jgi:hypothetical protein
VRILITGHIQEKSSSRIEHLFDTERKTFSFFNSLQDSAIEGVSPNFGIVKHGDYWYSGHHRLGIARRDQDLKILDFYSVGLISPHQLDSFLGSIWVCDTGNDRLIQYNPDTSSHLVIPFHPTLGRDLHHLNSVTYYNDLIYLLFHKRGDSEIVSYNPKTWEEVGRYKAGNQAHNLFEVNGKLWFCDSANSLLRSLDDSENILVRGFPRGVTVLNNRLYVGCSVNYKQDCDSFAFVCEIPLNDLSMRNYYALPGQRSIYELIVIN